MLSLRRVALSLCVLLTALAGVGRAQSAPAEVSGIVVDPSGAVVAGAEVVLRAASGRTEEVLTDLAGRFAFQGVPRGAFTLTAAFSRFEPVTVDLSAPQAGVRLVLQPLGLREAVTVVAPILTTSRTVTATRTDTPLVNVPQAVSVVTRGLVADQAMGSMADVVRYVPGVGMAQGEGHRDAPIFRGNTSTADFFVDGIRDDTQYFRDLYNVERIEAIKGPNGMVFGRGGVGGVINRVTRQADWMPAREFSLQGGNWNQRRMTTDLGHVWSPRVAARVTGVYENSDSYRSGVGVERFGINPTVAFALGNATTIRAGYEFFHDGRTTDRGIPSSEGLPFETAASTFFGSPSASNADITLHMLSTSLEHRFSNRVTLRNRLSYADYDKYYSNVFPGAINATRTQVSLSGYDSGTDRTNLFNQTDLTVSRRVGGLEHTLLVGTEVGRQVTDNLRMTAFFPTIGPSATSVSVPLDNPVTSLPVTYRTFAASDANNNGVANVAALYVQDQVAVTRLLQVVAGLRYDSFRVDLRDNRTGNDLSSDDDLVSPRVGVIVKPTEPVSFYANYSLSYLPRAGEQLASLTVSNATLEPERFRNVEVGAKWDVAPGLSFAAALYRLNRGNVAVADPNNPAVSLLVDGQRTSGLELELGGQLTPRWTIISAYALQDGVITRSLSASAVAGARLSQVPRHSFSMWNRYDVTRTLGLGLGIISQGDRFVGTDNLVVLPSFARVDAAAFFRLAPQVRLQVNVENLLDERYYPSAHNNNNITPGSPRALRIGLTTGF